MWVIVWVVPFHATKMGSIRQHLMLLTSGFALLLGAVLLLTGYRTALHESNEILDAQMRFLAQHSSQQHLAPTLKILNIAMNITSKI